MLRYLKICNLAHIESAQLDWKDGFTSVTGETGAGKSVLLGALSLLAGERADKSMIRSSAEACEVEASVEALENTALQALLEHYGLPPCDEGAMVLRRQIFAEKSGRIYVNGALTTRTTLQALGACWIDFHGPGEHQRLFEEARQLELIDCFAANAPLRGDYEKVYTRWRATNREIQELCESEQLSTEEQDYLRSQIEAIDAVCPEDEAIEKLEGEFNRACHQREFIEQTTAIEQAISSEQGALNALFAARQQAESLRRMVPQTSELANRLNAMIVELEDLAAEYGACARQDELEPDALEAIQGRMNAWLEVKRRYGPQASQVRAKRDALANKLASQSDIEGALEKLRLEQVRWETDARSIAEELNQSRQRAGERLCREVGKLLKSLGFKHARIQAEPIPSEELRDYGLARWRLLFQANAGSPLQALVKIASSGEAARVMLAIKAVLAEREATPVLVFDEVDANVGGEVGVEVGRELAALGKRHQVLCITHLPQVAAQASAHLSVSKTHENESTQVRIDYLNTNAERIEELSRMLGNRQSAAARKHAEELLKSF